MSEIIIIKNQNCPKMRMMKFRKQQVVLRELCDFSLTTFDFLNMIAEIKTLPDDCGKGNFASDIYSICKFIQKISHGKG